MTSKEIVELLCELVDLKELTNRGLILKDINNFQNQLEKDLEVLEIIKKNVIKNDNGSYSGKMPTYEEQKLLEEWFEDKEVSDDNI